MCQQEPSRKNRQRTQRLPSQVSIQIPLNNTSAASLKDPTTLHIEDFANITWVAEKAHWYFHTSDGREGHFNEQTILPCRASYRLSDGGKKWEESMSKGNAQLRK